ncbi:MAG: signal peptidase II, partial [Clostridia bacterium]|nr:signal peptidase II [Clostridia bacterium]
ENRGAAFGMLANNRWVFMSISVIAILAIAGFVLWKPQRLSVPETVGLGMMVSGGIGNMIDRVFLGYVVDFIDVRLIRFAVFNGADSFVCVGAGMLILGLALEIKEENKKR